METSEETKDKTKILDLEDAWLKYELSDVHLSFGQYVRKLEEDGYTINFPETRTVLS